MRLTEEELIRELREERPEVDEEFGRKLDEWAAAGFPRGGPAGGPGRRGLERAGSHRALRECVSGSPALRRGG